MIGRIVCDDKILKDIFYPMRQLTKLIELNLCIPNNDIYYLANNYQSFGDQCLQELSKTLKYIAKLTILNLGIYFN